MDRCFRLDPLLGAALENQQPAFRAGVLDCDHHQRLDQVLEDDLARDGLACSDDRGDV